MIERNRESGFDRARRLVAGGAVGITCAKVSEAEVMAAGGVDAVCVETMSDVTCEMLFAGPGANDQLSARLLTLEVLISSRGE